MITTLVYAKITTTPATAVSGILASTSTTAGTINPGGNWKKSGTKNKNYGNKVNGSTPPSNPKTQSKSPENAEFAIRNSGIQWSPHVDIIFVRGVLLWSLRRGASVGYVRPKWMGISIVLSRLLGG